MNESCLWVKVWSSAPMGILMRFYPSLPLSSGNPHLFVCGIKLMRHSMGEALYIVGILSLFIFVRFYSHISSWTPTSGISFSFLEK